jgi:repressor LexA
VKELTRRQAEILDFIDSVIRRRGYPPSVREIGKEFGISSTKGVVDHLTSIEKKGYIRRDRMISRGIEVTHCPNSDVPNRDVFEIPVIGRVAAGVPLLSEENIERWIYVDAFWVKPNRLFALRVNGDSMQGKGILHGDYVIVREQSVAERGDIIVAIIDDEATVKIYYPDEDCTRLEPANSAYEPIIIYGDIRIAGKVVGLIRNFEWRI